MEKRILRKQLFIPPESKIVNALLEDRNQIDYKGWRDILGKLEQIGGSTVGGPAGAKQSAKHAQRLYVYIGTISGVPQQNREIRLEANFGKQRAVGRAFHNSGGALKIEEFFELNFERGARQVDIAILASGVQVGSLFVPVDGARPGTV